LPVERDPLFGQDLGGLRQNVPERPRPGTRGANLAPAQMVRERLRHLAAAGVADADEKDVDGAGRLTRHSQSFSSSVFQFISLSVHQFFSSEFLPGSSVFQSFNDSMIQWLNFSRK